MTPSSTLQAGQAAAFGHLFSDAVRAGQSAVQTQHPGIYFQLGAEYAISRCAITVKPIVINQRLCQEEAGRLPVLRRVELPLA